MVAELKRKPNPSRRVLEAISEALEEIDGNFDASGFWAGEVEAVGTESPVVAVNNSETTEGHDNEDLEEDDDTSAIRAF